MKRPILLWRFIATLCLLLTLCCSFVVHAAPYGEPAKDLGGFTPNPEVTLSFPSSRYAAGSTAKAEVSITGPTNGTYSVDIKNVATGSVVASISLQIGGAPGSNKGSVNVTLPSTTGDVTYRATFQSATDDATVTGVGVSKIQWQSGTSYVDVSDTLYVVKGTTINFRAVSDPSGSWPSNKPTWGGSASGNGETTSVSFNTVSSSTFNPFKVTAECGNTVSADVVVYDYALKATPDDDFDNRDYESYGVGETVQLSLSTTPPSVGFSVVGLWTKTGSGNLPDTGTDSVATYTAGEVGGNVTIKFAITQGPSAGQEKTISRGVVAPSGVSFKKVPGTDEYHQQYTISAGVSVNAYLLPANVSFSKIAVAELAAPSVSTGSLAALNFAHPRTDTDRNPATNDYVTVAKPANATDGSLVNLPDNLQVGPAQLPTTDPTGSLYWDIPWVYIVTNAPPYTEYTIATIRQLSSIDSTGGATVSKGNITVSKAYNDPSSGVDQS